MFLFRPYVIGVTAVFALSGCKLTIDHSENGLVSTESGSVYCGEDCTHYYGDDVTEILIPDPDPGYYFADWSAFCVGPVCALSMSPTEAPKRISATFWKSNLDVETPPFVWRVHNIRNPFNGISALPVDEHGDVYGSLIGVTDRITIEFNEEINPDLIGDGSIIIWDETSGKYVEDYSVVVGEDNRSIGLNLETPLERGAHYVHVFLDVSHIQDLDGNSLTEASTLSELIVVPDYPSGYFGNLANDVSYDALYTSTVQRTYIKLNLVTDVR